MENIFEFEDIRKQMTELKQRLDRESTLNEQLLHDSLRTKMRSVDFLVRKVICIGTAGVAAWIFLGMEWDLSPWFVAFTCLMMLTSMTAEYLINRMRYDSFTTNLKDTVTRLVRMKKMRQYQIVIGFMVLILLWMPWLVYEFSQRLEGYEVKPMIIGAAVGFVIGAAVGLRIFFKMQRTNDEMIRQIEDFMA